MEARSSSSSCFGRKKVNFLFHGAPRAPERVHTKMALFFILPCIGLPLKCFDKRSKKPNTEKGILFAAFSDDDPVGPRLFNGRCDVEEKKDDEKEKRKAGR